MILFFIYKKLTDSDYKTALKDYLNNTNFKSEETVRKEVALIKDFWKCDPMHYYRYRLFEKDLSYEELIDYVPSYYFYNHYMPSIYGNLKTLPVIDSKIRMNDYFRTRNIDTPATLAIIKKGNIFDPAGQKLLYNELAQKLSASGSPAFFVKPDKGMGGSGIFTIKKTIDRFIIDTVIMDEKLFASRTRNKDFIIQESISQRSDIKAINQTSVNTLRVITQRSGNNYKIPAVVLRIGRNGSYVDNSAQGGISVNIDIESGQLNKYAFTEHTNEKFTRHPDSGFRFEGFALRDWDKIKQSILDYAAKAPEFPDVAWDIAIMEDGITVIEINLNYGIDHLQCCIGGMRRRLNINPEVF
jgi:hypothetical protein